MDGCKNKTGATYDHIHVGAGFRYCSECNINWRMMWNSLEQWSTKYSHTCTRPSICRWLLSWKLEPSPSYAHVLVKYTMLVTILTSWWTVQWWISPTTPCLSIPLSVHLMLKRLSMVWRMLKSITVTFSREDHGRERLFASFRPLQSLCPCSCCWESCSLARVLILSGKLLAVTCPTMNSKWVGLGYYSVILRHFCGTSHAAEMTRLKKFDFFLMNQGEANLDIDEKLCPTSCWCG